jgi:hypothetical protein
MCLLLHTLVYALHRINIGCRQHRFSLASVIHGGAVKCRTARSASVISQLHVVRHELAAVHCCTLLDTAVHAGHCWTPLDTAGHRWTLLDTAGHRWTLLDTAGHCWTLLYTLDTAGHCWTRWTRGQQQWKTVANRGGVSTGLKEASSSAACSRARASCCTCWCMCMHRLQAAQPAMQRSVAVH